MKLAPPSKVENCKCEPVALTDIDEVVKTAEKMFKIMTDNNGIGLAAPQVGIFKRFFIMRDFLKPGYKLFINPVVSWESNKTASFKEGCLTYNTPSSKPYWYVRRSKSIEASWLWPDGIKVSEKMSKLTAQVFQHEFDHLNSITIKNKKS